MEYPERDYRTGGTMKKEQKEKFRQILESQLEALMLISGKSLSEMLSENAREIEYIDLACADADRTMKFRIRSRESRLIRKIQEALQRIENDTYGICEFCEEEISLRRLEARPVTTKCIECKKEEERLELLTQ